MADNTNTNAEGGAGANAADEAGVGQMAGAEAAAEGAVAGDVAPPPGSVPVTVMGNLTSASVAIRIGTQWVRTTNAPPPGSTWFVVIDLTFLQVVANVVSTSKDQVPPALGPYIGNPGFLLIATSVAWRWDSVPQGALYSFLRSTGSGGGLERAEQLYAQLGTGYFSNMGYILAATLDPRDGSGFEEFSHFGVIPIMTFSLMPVTVADKTKYVPIRTWH